MKTLVIPKKPSGTGSIHDIESDLEPLYLHFRTGEKFAVVLPAFYNFKPIFCRSKEAAIEKGAKLRREGYTGVRAIEDNGDLWICWDETRLAFETEKFATEERSAK